MIVDFKGQKNLSNIFKIKLYKMYKRKLNIAKEK